jgi:serine protease Do
VHRGQIGARAQTITPLLAAGLGLSQSWGVLLSDVKPDGPAAKAGLAIGDLVVSLDGKPMENARQFDVNLYRRTTGETLSIEVLREQRKWLVRVDVAERPDDADRLAEMVNPENNVVRGLGILGLDLDDRVAALLPALRAKAGVVVAMAAAGAGGSDPLRAGDVIYSLNGEPVPGLDKLRLLIAALKPGGPVVLQVERSSELRYLAFEWGE